MARRIYSILIAISIGIGLYLYTLKGNRSDIFMLVVSSAVFFIFSVGIHGLLAHSLPSKAKGGILLYPILMGVLWAVLFLLFVFLILPLLCPDFLLRP